MKNFKWKKNEKNSEKKLDLKVWENCYKVSINDEYGSRRGPVNEVDSIWLKKKTKLK